jgi:hypothetical protein
MKIDNDSMTGKLHSGLCLWTRGHPQPSQSVGIQAKTKYITVQFPRTTTKAIAVSLGLGDHQGDHPEGLDPPQIGRSAATFLTPFSACRKSFRPYIATGWCPKPALPYILCPPATECKSNGNHGSALEEFGLCCYNMLAIVSVNLKLEIVDHICRLVLQQFPFSEMPFKSLLVVSTNSTTSKSFELTCRMLVWSGPSSGET